MGGIGWIVFILLTTFFGLGIVVFVWYWYAVKNAPPIRPDDPPPTASDWTVTTIRPRGPHQGIR